MSTILEPSARLREWRDRRRYSLREVAERAGIWLTTVHRIEVGRMSPTVAMLEKLAEALEIDVRDLFTPSRRSKPKRRR